MFLLQLLFFLQAKQPPHAKQRRNLVGTVVRTNSPGHGYWRGEVKRQDESKLDRYIVEWSDESDTRMTTRQIQQDRADPESQVKLATFHFKDENSFKYNILK